MSANKAVLAKWFGRFGVSEALIRLQSAWLRPHLRAVNYHDVPRFHADDFARQLRWYRQRFDDTRESDLDELLRGQYRPERPGLIVSFDDGLRSAFEVAAPLLEEHGFTGWFMVPVGFVDCAVTDQQAYAREHQILHRDTPSDGRIAMSWDEVRDLAKRHVVTCHGMTHTRLDRSLAPEDFAREIRDAKDQLEARLGASVHGFTWIGGEEWSYSAEGARAIRKAGFRYAFMTNSQPITARTNPFQLQRTNIEAWFPIELVAFQLSGLMDALYIPKRKRVNALTAV